MDDSTSELIPGDGLNSSVAYEVLDVPYYEKGAKLGGLEGGAEIIYPSTTGIVIEPTTKRELIAWWLYYFAYEPVSVVAMVLLIPLLLQQLALKAGHLPGDLSAACTAANSAVCVVFSLFGGAWDVTPSAFAYYVIAMSVAAQAVTFVSVGALADYGRLRKFLLTGCTWLGVACLAGMLMVRDERWLGVAGLLTVTLSMFYGTASVFYNAYLPLLVQSHPKYLALLAEAVGAEDQDKNGEANGVGTNQTGHVSGANQTGQANDINQAGPTNRSAKKIAKKKEKLGSFISTVGMAAGYSAGVLMVCGMIGYFAMFGSEGMALQVCIAACGGWWLVWSVFPLIALKFRPGPPLPPGSNYLSFSWGKLTKTLRRARQLPTTFAFLLGYFFFSDGYNTMGSAAILIAKQSLDVGLTELTVCALIAPICALVGAFTCFLVQRVLKASNKTMLLGILVLLGAIPLYCALGLISVSPVGIREKWEIYAITAVYGFFIGAVQSFARCLFADLIPAGEEAEFFSLYAVTDKGSAFMGPMVVAVLADWTKEPRFGLLFLAALILVPIPFIHKYVQRGKPIGKEALNGK